ncbi:MAG: hypothetical protein RMZ43_025940 [Nostoc sp. CmiVER01]|nr:hypothetical protein [Nostoc sp. CmiVER01]MDZ8121350.1 hypothetical protein [Nostoc sp. CmiVER01]
MSRATPGANVVLLFSPNLTKSRWLLPIINDSIKVECDRRGINPHLD